MHTIDFTIKMLHRNSSIHQLFPAQLVSYQDLSAGIAVSGHETSRLGQALIVLHALEDLEVAGCTSHKEEHQSYRHQPDNNNT